MTRRTAAHIISPSDAPRLVLAQASRTALDLTKRSFTHRVGRIEIIGSWWFSPDLDRMEPCLVLLPANWDAPGRPRPTPCIVPESDAWKWAVDPSNPAELDWLRNPAAPANVNAPPPTPPGLVSAIDFAPDLGLTDDDLDILTIYHTVRSRLDDLLRIPPLPPATTAVAEVRLTTDEGTIEREVHHRHA